MTAPAGTGIWQIWVDTGGTFTDCLALAPDGRLHRAKVLSSSALRARVLVAAGRRLELELSYPLPAGFLRGFDLLPLAQRGARATVVASDGEGRVELARELPRPLASGDAVELQSPEEAPVLAARVVTATAGEADLPALRCRLATTRGTNALLERRGAPTALFITRGFADLLAIGTQQRPDLFALAVRKPEALAAAVVEVEERLAADGSVLTPLDLSALARPARELLARGISTAAVALLHSYRNPGHEQAVAAFLRQLGFATVSCSAELAPLVKLLPRAQTAVVDATLAPVVGGYLERVAAQLGGSALHVMTSAGGLVGAAGFRGKDSLLSGPAGGVVGASRAGLAAGRERLIAFDMGGTSTDVSRFDGDYDHVFEHEVAGVRLAAPALAIETVAAGGGSLCWYDGHQLKVGPASAGARPGPACYGAGGPLTLTDVNLLLGRLDPERFEIPLDPSAAAAASARLEAEVAGSLAGGVGRERLLAGLLAIADERMAEAIRVISVARGYDPRDATLVSFGGAGGQHACAVAELLGMRAVLVPADCGLLSAAGLGQAVIERFAERQVLKPLPDVLGPLAEAFTSLAAAAVAAVEAEGGGLSVEVRRRLVFLRLAGQDATVSLDWGPGVDLQAAFADAYRELYGYPPPARAVEVESLRVVASSQPPPRPASGPPAAAHPAAACGTRPVYFGSSWLSTLTYLRPDLAPGAQLEGPALVLERHATTVVPPGWQGQVTSGGALLLARREE